MKRQNDEISQSKEEQKNEPKEMEAKVGGKITVESLLESWY